MSTDQGHTSELRARLLLAIGLAACGGACKATPDATTLAPASQPARSVGDATVPEPLRSSAASASSLVVEPPPPSAAASTPMPAPSSTASSGPSAPFPYEPVCQGHCTLLETCRKPLDKAPSRPMASPFELCPLYSGAGAFSVARTRQKRTTQPDTCCYLEARRLPVKGRPLLGARGLLVAALGRSSAW